jgi:FtsP/CotA-like multicopper oxidase with cupredoxin domain
MRRTARADEISSVNGLLDVSLEASEEWVVVGGRSAQLYTYNRQSQAPRLIASPGDTVRLRLTNRLQEATNLHYHGLHISPGGTADNIFLRVEPGATQLYEFQIPPSHPGGTYWYHPHIHPNTARQVSRGLVGVFVVRGELDRMAPFATMPEHSLVLQDFRLDASGYITEPLMMERMQGREGSFITVSGQVNPSIPIAAGGWVRLRVLNASPSRYYRLSIEQHTMYRIATDGGAVPSPEPLTELLLTPGERVDLAVQGERGSGTYRLLSLPYDRHRGEMMGGGGMMHGGMMGGGMMGGTAPSTQLTLATLRYQGSATPSDLPAQLVAVDAIPAPTLPVRRVTLGQGMRMMFTINGRRFDHNRVDVRAQLGTVEDWEFVNATGMDHPMHVHTNPFQVLDTSGRPVRAWKDTVNVRANSRVRIRTRFADYAGLSVFHCHILDHEDLGMMATLQLNE